VILEQEIIELVRLSTTEDVRMQALVPYELVLDPEV